MRVNTNPLKCELLAKKLANWASSGPGSILPYTINYQDQMRVYIYKYMKSQIKYSKEHESDIAKNFNPCKY